MYFVMRIIEVLVQKPTAQNKCLLQPQGTGKPSFNPGKLPVQFGKIRS